MNAGQRDPLQKDAGGLGLPARERIKGPRATVTARPQWTNIANELDARWLGDRSWMWSKFLLWVLAAVCASVLLLLAANLWPDPQRVRSPLPHRYSVADPQFAQTMAGLTGGVTLDGHDVKTLVNGDEIFPSMLEAIAGARATVNFETY